MKITLRQLSYFRALAQARNFGRAAELANVSQPALSMQIKELEAILGVALVERLPRDVRLTRAGREVLARAERILSETMELESSARRQGLQAALTLGMIPTIAPYLLPGMLARLRAGDITRDLRLREAQTSDLLAALREGRLDAVVLADPVAAPDLVISPLFQDRFLLAGSQGRLGGPDPGHRALEPTALNPDHLLLLDDGHCLADQALAVCAIDRRQTRLDLGASTLSTLCGLVAQGFGLTLLPELAVRAEAAGGQGIVLRRFARPEPFRQIALLRRASSDQGAWFDDLGVYLCAAGEELIAAARLRCPPV
ncbi:hydrogen peroxide-inducible genes activator [Roseinatronobacter alkalisoli]|uniref:LysR substrate-binding domain-containing protein n=1 Tax=Roseinatronobacter alkalisoli TaxID=3028235 RepID=A0ABT5TBK7_9RHOB|nr:hydrogen peroxide-inducible genes activator [Roseinatronobacter sp. HJB301]MDD7972506.1 LysR substrate-binding domain-containing protein [Roseinatronobacter sp. HJB301]